METLLHYVWAYKLYENPTFRTTEGIPFEVVDPGIRNSDAGPDFFNAKIKLDGKTWAGNVEIHSLSSDWYKHHHEKDKAYNSVILHVVEHVDEPDVRDEAGRSIPQWIMHTPAPIRERYASLLDPASSVSCLGRIREIPELYLTDWKCALLHERLRRKSIAVARLLEEYHHDWNEVFYILLARSFGFGINNDAFERLAKSLPLKVLMKHRDSPSQTEALLLGQADLLREEENDDIYYLELRNEYLFLRKKYDLQPLESYIFKSLRIRPNNFPHIKIVQLAHIIRENPGFFSRIIGTESLPDWKNSLATELNEYWLTHYRFGKKSVRKSKRLGGAAVRGVVINCLVPILFTYGKEKDSEMHIRRALKLLEDLPAEKNFIVSLFSRAGIRVENAGDTQALIELKREYCEKKKCIFCRIGHKLLSKRRISG